MFSLRSFVAVILAPILVSPVVAGPGLQQHFTLRAYISKDQSVAGPYRDGPLQLYIPILSGFLQGEGVNAAIQPGGADANQVDTTATPEVSYPNVRTHARTSDGEAIYIQYQGIAVVNNATQLVISFSPDAKSTNFGDAEFFITPTFLTTIASLKWIETATWVGQGRWVVDSTGTAVEYRVYRVVN